jgi:hypothetical protein
LATLAVGIGCAVVGGVRGWSHPEFPFFTNPAFQATPDGTRITATLKGSRLDSSDSVIFFVDTLRWVQEKGTFDVTHRRADSLGPDAEGNINQPISTLIPPGDYREVGLIAWAGEKAEFSSAPDCYNQGKQRREISCVVLTLERIDEKPQLQSEWIRQNGQELLKVTVAARYTQSRPIFVTVTGLRRAGRRRELASFGLEPDTTGHFQRTVHLTVPRRYDRVCVVARAGEGPTGCPHQPRRHARPETVWQVLGRNVNAASG